MRRLKIKSPHHIRGAKSSQLGRPTSCRGQLQAPTLIAFVIAAVVSTSVVAADPVAESYYPIASGNWWLYSASTAKETDLLPPRLVGYASGGSKFYSWGAGSQLYELVEQGESWYASSITALFWCANFHPTPRPYFMPHTKLPEANVVSSYSFTCAAPQGTGTNNMLFQVLGTESVTVPAGHFKDAVRVRITSSGTFTITEPNWPPPLTGGGSAVEDTWLVKGVGRVKSVFGGGQIVWELMHSSLLSERREQELLGRCESLDALACNVSISAGNVFITESAALGQPSVPFAQHYNSQGQRPGPMGYGWTHSYSHKASLAGQEPKRAIVLERPDGKVLKFSEPTTPLDWWIPDGSSLYKMRPIVVNGNDLELLVWTPELSIERYDSDGTLLAIYSASGGKRNIERQDAGLQISRVVDDFGRGLDFTYEDGVRLTSVQAIGGSSSVVFGYDSEGNFDSANYDGQHTRRYVYSPMAIGGAHGSRRYGLTGVFDDGSQTARRAWKYNDSGEAGEVSGPGTQRIFERVPVGGGRIHITDALDNSFDVDLELISGLPRPIAFGVGANGHFGARFKTASYDALGRTASSIDFRGFKACFSHEAGRPLEIIRVEGLAANTACSVTAQGASLPEGSRKVSTQWHPDWNLQTKVAEPGRRITKTYNGQGASCAPVAAKLPDGKPIVVLCKQVEEATLDANGSQGFAAALDPGVPKREQSWTYNEFGQVLTHDGPQPGNGDVTTYEYYSDTTADWTKGDLKLVRNAADHTTSFHKYDKAGRPLRMRDANQVVTEYTYDLRQRIKTVTVDGQATNYDYYPTGLLKQVTQPDDSFVAYEYDDAHRLVSLKDHLNNRVDYVLDNAGNRKEEKVSDTNGALTRQSKRVFDALGRLEKLTGRE